MATSPRTDQAMRTQFSQEVERVFLVFLVKYRQATRTPRAKRLMHKLGDLTLSTRACFCNPSTIHSEAARVHSGSLAPKRLSAPWRVPLYPYRYAVGLCLLSSALTEQLHAEP